MNKSLNKAVIIISKIGEVGAWIGSGFSAVGVVMAALGRIEALSYISSVNQSPDASVNGFSIGLLDSNGQPVTAAYVILFVTLLLMCVLTAMVCRNINLIFKTAEGKTKFAKGATPFQPEIIRMVKEIGYFLIAMPVIGIIMQIICGIVSHGAIEVSVEMNSIFVGLVVLALSQYFAYGMELQNDIDGLV